MTDTQTRERRRAVPKQQNFADAWKNNGETENTIAGVVEGRSTRPKGGKVKQSYPILTLVVKPVTEFGEVVDETDPEALVSTQDEETIPYGTRKAVHSGRKALREFLEDQDPQEGDVVVIVEYPKVQKRDSEETFVPYDAWAWTAKGEPKFEVEDEVPDEALV